MVFKSALSKVNGVFQDFLKSSVDSFFYLETGVKDTPYIVAADGSILSILRVDGLKMMIGADEMDDLVSKMTDKFSSYFKENGHAMQFWFARDPDGSSELVRRMNSPARQVSGKLNLDLDDLFDEREKHLSKFIVWEGSYIALWTRPSVLTQQELEHIKKGQGRPDIWPRAAETQNIFKASTQMLTRHKAFISSVAEDFKNWNMRVTPLDAHKALGVIRGSLYPDLMGGMWRPQLPGDHVTPRENMVRSGDMSHIFAAPLRDQMFSAGGEVLSPRIVRVGRYNFASMDMVVGPQNLTGFSELLGRMNQSGNEFPWRASFLIEGNGLSGGVQLKAQAAAILGFSNSENKQISAAVKALKNHKNEGIDGGVVVRLRASFSTWAPSDDIQLIEERASLLQRSVESWGQCSVSSSSGDPLASFMGTALGVDVASTAPPGCPPMYDSLYMLPWDRDASPWDKGSVLFRTEDGRPFPYEPGSSKQDTACDILYAPPGKGKSVLLNTCNLAFCLSPSATSTSLGDMLPMLRILDIGVSSSGLISAIKEALPPKDRHLVQYLRLKMIREHAINPLDTQLGNRYPLSSERSAKINILSQIATPVGSSAPSEDLPELIALVLDEAYKHFDDQSPTGQPKMYQRGLNLSIDAKIDEYGFNVEEVCWYELGDMFFDQGDTHYAHLAQKFAVPLLEDLNIIVRKSSIVDMWGEAQNGQLIGNFSRMIGAALRSYPILTQPTRFDIGDSRVVALDLDEAAPRGGGAAEKQTALVYMLARMILADDFYLTEDDLINFPKKYQSYHQKRIKTLRETPKKLVFDEFHRTASSPQVRNQVVVDIREGRKWGVHISLVSQLLGDFDKDMVDMATNIFFLGVNTSSAIQEAARIFGLTPAAQRVIRSKLNGPSRKGAPFLALMNLKDGVHEHLLYNTLGPQELWAFSTTPQDAALRNSLYKRVGPKRARVALARSYPDGSVVPEIEARLARLMESGMRDIDKSQIIEDLEKEILSMLE